MLPEIVNKPATLIFFSVNSLFVYFCILVAVYFVLSSDVGIQDRVVIQELIKNVAQVNQLDSSTQKDFKGWSAILG